MMIIVIINTIIIITITILAHYKIHFPTVLSAQNTC